MIPFGGSTMKTSFFVPGIPAPKGSTRAFVVGKRAVVTETNKATRPWVSVVQVKAGEFMQGKPVADGAVCLALVFNLPRPKSLPKRVKHHLKKPDLDKLVRAVKDALTGILYRDDAQVVSLIAKKHYAEPYGVHIDIQ